MPKIKLSLPWILVLALLIFTRIYGINWGLPFPFHPDERNMASAIQNLSCYSLTDIQNCFNPRFFAYGQFPLYLSSILVFIMKFFDGDLMTPISFEEATIALRFISVWASLGTTLLIYKILTRIFSINNGLKKGALLLLFVFSPGLIQFAHFGTTESLLILFFIWLIYESLLLINQKISLRHFVLISSLVTGAAIATKVSAAVFFTLPMGALAISFGKDVKKYLIPLISTGLLTISFAILFSPHNLISFTDFLGSMRYESDVALGRLNVFYTHQFKDTYPIWFQIKNIFPYALGLPAFVLFLLGLFTLPKNKNHNFLRFAFLVYFLPTAFLFVKWTRFMAPLFPLMLLMGGLTLYYLVKNKVLFYFLAFLMLIPGVAFMSIYFNNDVRQTASDWIYANVPANSYILSETANVVDIPLQINNFYQDYNYISFNFYELQQDEKLQLELKKHLENTDFIFVPSRRVFANLKNNDGLLEEYYQNLNNGNLGFEKVAEFNSYPKITLFGNTLLELPDEEAEETFTVFDHPVIRIYKRK